jgi:hypothetical protein
MAALIGESGVKEKGQHLCGKNSLAGVSIFFSAVKRK